MGVSSTINRVSTVGDGSTTTFGFPYYFFKQSDLLVYIYDTVAGGISGPYVLNTDYTISGTPNYDGLYSNGGSVVFGSIVPAITDIVVILRSPPQQQNYSLLQGGTISSSAVVQQFDYMTLLVQRIQDEVSRCIKLPDGIGSSFSGDLPDTTAKMPGYCPVVNGSGNGWTLAQPGGGAGGGTVSSVGLSMPVSVFAVASSPITSSGTITVTFNNQAANLVLAGPSSGGAAAPTFRSLVAADLPSVPGSVVYIGPDANYTIPNNATYVRAGALTADRAYTLRSASSVGDEVTIKNHVSNTHNIVATAAGGDTVETFSSVTITPGNSVRFKVGIAGQWDAN